MTEDEIIRFIGFDWGSETHRVSLFDRVGKLIAWHDVAHSGSAQRGLFEWLVRSTQASPAQIGVAIETLRGPAIDALLDRGFQVFATSPKQLDRCRERYNVAGAKDDTRDADVLGRCLRTDPDVFRLTRSGPYCLARRPIYTAILLAILGSAVAEAEWRGYAGLVLITLSFVRKIAIEERFLIAQFGDAYARYRAEVPALIPWL